LLSSSAFAERAAIIQNFRAASMLILPDARAGAGFFVFARSRISCRVPLMKFRTAWPARLKQHRIVLAIAFAFPLYALVTRLNGPCETCSPLLSGLPILPIAQAQAAGPAEKFQAPAWELKDIEGRTIKSSDFKGKVVMLNFWGTWCPPCVAEIPDLIALQKKYADRGFTVIGAAYDPNPEGVAEFAREHGINYPVVLANEDVLAAFRNVEAFPTSFFIDREGVVTTSTIGLVEPGTFEKIIEPLL
jgi:cytochrome c biogenesis protein CcmG/thiol:disulfide interchange protein DsbE